MIKVRYPAVASAGFYNGEGRHIVIVVVVWRGISSKTDERTKAEGLSFFHPGHQTAWVRC